MNTYCLNEFLEDNEIPASCFLSVSNYQNLIKNLKNIKNSLLNFGVSIVELENNAFQEDILLKIVSEIGVPHSHNNLDKVLWDVKPGGEDGKSKIARSHKMDVFDMHTDCSYEEKCPDYIGLHVIKADKLGGGFSRILSAKTIINKLSKKSLDTLQNTLFKIHVPKEFKKNKNFIYGKVIDEDLSLRYRKEIIDLKNITFDQKIALEEFDKTVNAHSNSKKFLLKDGQILLINNKKFLHGRTEVHDKERHLKRIRFFLNRN